MDQEKNQCNVQDVKDIISALFLNPFAEMDFMSLSFGDLPPENVKLYLLIAHQIVKLK